jgi:hypothetical protein
VPVGFHAPLAQACAMLYPAPDVPLSAEVYMGPTWGTLSRVDNVSTEQAQAAQDLAQPGRMPRRCPLCDKVAPDEPTLQQHLTDAHSTVEAE